MSPEIIRLIYEATLDTPPMVSIAMVFATDIGLPLGVLLATSGSRELLAAPVLNRVLALIVNATRSKPFIILVVAIIPFTRLVAGTSIGTRAAIVPLTVAAAPFVGVVEAAIREVDPGLIEAARAMGATPLPGQKLLWQYAVRNPRPSGGQRLGGPAPLVRCFHRGHLYHRGRRRFFAICKRLPVSWGGRRHSPS
jgi:ABC-type methionine transport system permease subunit